MIAINNLTFEIGARALYDEANWHIKPGEKIGLIGANGTGKTTLLKIITGEYTPTSGTISKAKDLTKGWSFQWITNTFLVVDAFFFISGLLLRSTW